MREREQEVRLAWAKTRMASLAAAAMYAPRAVADAMEAERQMDRAQRTVSEAGWTVADVGRALGELRTAGVRVADVRTPNLSHLAVSGTLDLPPGAWVHGIATPAEGPIHPDVTHSAEQEPDVTELSISREPTPEERRDAWVVLATKLEGWLLATEQRALGAADLHQALAKYNVPGMVSRNVEAQKARAWAARRLLEQVQAWSPPVVPRDDEKGQGSILELFPGEPSTAVENPVEETEGHRERIPEAAKRGGPKRCSIRGAHRTGWWLSIEDHAWHICRGEA